MLILLGKGFPHPVPFLASDNLAGKAVGKPNIKGLEYIQM